MKKLSQELLLNLYYVIALGITADLVGKIGLSITSSALGLITTFAAIVFVFVYLFKVEGIVDSLLNFSENRDRFDRLQVENDRLRKLVNKKKGKK